MRGRNQIVIACLVGGALLSNAAFAGLYKWVAADGKVTYSDTPPPAHAKRLQTKVSTDGGVDTSNLPPDLAAAVNMNPVTLYTANSCAPCDEGRAFLKSSGIPFSEKTIQTPQDFDALKKISSDMALPLMVIRNTKFPGFATSTWRTALTSAGYPEASQLPRDYRFVGAEPLTQPAAPVVKEKKVAPARPAAPAVEPAIRF